MGTVQVNAPAGDMAFEKACPLNRPVTQGYPGWNRDPGGLLSLHRS